MSWSSPATSFRRAVFLDQFARRLIVRRKKQPGHQAARAQAVRSAGFDGCGATRTWTGFVHFGRTKFLKHPGGEVSRGVHAPPKAESR